MSLLGLVPGILTDRFTSDARSPIAEKGEEVGDVDGAAAAARGDVAGAGADGITQTPVGEQLQQISHVDHAVQSYISGSLETCLII